MIPLLAQAATDIDATAPAGDPPAFEQVQFTALIARALEVISPYMPVFFVAFAVALAMTPLMRYLALRNHIVDMPSEARKLHKRPIAYLGGVAILLGWLAGVLACHLIPPHTGIPLSLVHFPLSIVLGAAVITLTGLFDDIYGISPRVKIAGQIFGAAMLAHEDVGIQLVRNSLGVLQFLPTGGLPGVASTLAAASAPPEWVVLVLGTAVIAGFVVGGCNAVNLLDGLDGLASGVTGVASVGFLLIAAFVAVQALTPGAALAEEWFIWDPARLVMCLAILGAVLGFLPYNFNPANIFMGDAGSLLLGYLSVSTILMFANTGPRSLFLVTAALIVFAVPITDTSLAIFRRKMRGQPLFSPDDQHIHHLLKRSGMSVRKAVLTIYAAGAVFAAVGVLMVAIELRARFLMAIFVVMYGFIMVTAYKYGELALLAAREADPNATPPTASEPTPSLPFASEAAAATPVATTGPVTPRPASPTMATPPRGATGPITS